MNHKRIAEINKRNARSAAAAYGRTTEGAKMVKALEALAAYHQARVK